MNCKQCPRSAIRLLGLFVAIFALVSSASATWKEKVLYSFQGGNSDGALPVGKMVFDVTGNLYGATTQGGGQCVVAQCGTVFELTPSARKGDPWIETVIHIFEGGSGDGNLPAGGLVIDSAGNLYGTTAYGGSGACTLLGTPVGCGTVFELSPPTQKGGAWTETVLYNFQSGEDGYLPQGDLVFDKNGNLYGATEYGGGYGTCNSPYYPYCGTVFELSPPKKRNSKWKETVLYSFKGGMDGANPNGGLVFDSAGSIYGTTYIGGSTTNCLNGQSSGCGTVFDLKPPKKKTGQWVERILYQFNGYPTDGAGPNGNVLFHGQGQLYGTTVGGWEIARNSVES